MAKRVCGPVLAECIGAEPCCRAKTLNWENWRLDFIGRIGNLEICESQQRSPGRAFLFSYENDISEMYHTANLDDVFNNGADWWLKTYYGEWSREGECLVFQTRTTRYVFRIKRKENNCV